MKNLIFKSSFHEKLKMLLIAVGLMVTSLTTQMWGWNSWSSKTIYFDNSYWASDGYTPQLLIGRYYTYGSDSRGSSAETMTNISGTDLWYLSSYSYNNYTNEYFISNSSTWPNEYGCNYDGCSNCPESRVTYAAHYTNSYNTNGNNTYNLFVPTSASNNASLTYTSNSSYSTLLNSTQRIYQCVSENGGTPAKSTASIGTISISTKYLSSATAASNASGSISSGSNTVYKSAARTATVTMTATSIADGYTFLGWYDAESGGNRLESNTTYTYQASAAKTVYARFSHETTHTVNITYVCASPSATVATATSQAIGQVTASSITAPTVEGYTFSSWTLGSGMSNQSASTSVNPISVKTLGSGNYTMQANYTEDITSHWHLVGNSSDFPDGWNVNNTTMMQKKTGHSTDKIVYFTVNVTSTDTKEFKVVDDNGSGSDIYYGYSTGGTYLTWTATSTKSVYTGSGNANNLKYTPTVAGPYEFKVDYSGTYPAVTITYPTAYTLTYSIGSVAGNNGSISTSPTTASGSKVLSGNTVTLTGPAAKTGYAWKGWYTNAAGTEGKVADTNRAITVTMNADKTLYACYTENNYTVTVNAGTGGSVASGSVTGHYSTKVTLPTATANPGYYFTGWEVTSGTATLTSASSATAAKINGMTAAVTVRANFAPIWRIACSSDSYNTESHQITTITTSAGAMTSGSVTIDLDANTDYEFKVYNKSTNKWWGHSGTVTKITYTNKGTAQSLSEATGNNQTFRTAGKGTYTFTWNVSTSKISIGYPTSYTVTFGYGTGGSAVTASVESSGAITSGQYAAAGKDITFTQTPATGYELKGWYTASSGGTAVSGMSKTDNVLDDIAANANVYAQYEGKTYTVSFNINGGSGATPDPISVTYGAAYGTLPAGPTPSGADQFVGWSTTSEGAGTIVTAETPVTTARNHTLYARFEHTYTVTVQYKCGTQTLRASTTVHASESAVAADISAPIILGYEFDEWTGDNTVTFADATSATTTVHATAATAITANYTAVPMVYFKNNLAWDNVYVSFDNTWKEIDGKQVPSNQGKPYYKMTQLGTSDIFYCEIPSDYVANNYANWKWNIAFDNTNYGSTAETTHTGAWDEFYGGKFLGRGDFDPSATMYIPYDGDTETRNSGTYYRTGCWMKYNSTDPGYKIYANTYVSGAGGTAVAGTPVLLTADVAGGFEFKGKVNFPKANYSYGFMLKKEATKNTNDLWYTNTGAIYSTTTSLPWHFYTDGASENGQRCEIHTEATGEYEFTVSFGTGRPVVDVVYPVGEGDYRLVYKDLATWSNGAHTADWQHPSRVIKANANAEDIVSFYVSKADGANASIKLHKCTSIDGSGNPVWDKGTTVDLSGISETGIYNFKVTQNESKVATVAFDGSYTGNFYVRTDASDGGWSNYKTSGANTMTYSEYSVTHGGDFGPYSHYFMRHVNSGSNIKFCIANDYSECISDTVVDDTYAHEWIEVEANVRFMWYYGTNKIGRAYVSGSTNVSDRFLVLEGDEHLYDADGHPLTGTYQVKGLNEYEMKFIDDQNWVYETTVQANPLERVKLTAKFNNKIQYFYGAEGDRTEATTHQLIGGTGSDKYKMRVVYDFKTNRLVAAWLPSEAVTTEFDIDADVMIIRYHQADAQQITFSGSGKLKDVQTVYGAMQFNKYRLNNQSEAAGHSDLGLSQYERDLFFISFPFDVKLNDVFGFGTYGKHWIIEYYDGKTRAQNGFWADSPSNWKFVTKAMKDVFTLKANEGYVLALDLDELTMSSSVWDYGVENVYLYFPSTTTIDKIQATSATVDIDQTGYECTINRNTPDGDRRVKDSYWHLLGVPSYANATNTTSGSWTGTVPNQNPDTWTSSAPYVYSWNGHDNKFGVISSTSTTFKPMQSYLVQYAKPTIEWASVNATPKAVAARRAQNQLRDCEFRLQLMQNDEELDHTFISMRDDEEVTAEFDFSYDLSKMLYGAFTSACNVYTLIGEEQAAANCLPLTEQTTVVPVGLKVADDGEYTFSMPDGTNGVGVTLIDGVTGERTNLALMDYTVSLEKGTYDQRFVLEISPIEHTTTAIENSEKTDAPNNVCKKLIYGVLYIIKDGKVFDARGARLQ